MINFDQLNDKKYLQAISQNADLLEEEINNTRGYVLYVMEKENIYPSLELLLEKENVFSLNFILKNYELNKDQLRNLKKYFSNEGDNQVVNEVLEIEEIEKYLKEGKLLPKNTILTLEVINRNSKNIVKAFADYEYDMGNILKNSFKNLSVEEFLSLEVLVHDPELFLLKPSGFNDSTFNKAYKDTYFKFIENSQKHKPYIRDFELYHFQKEDKEMLLSLLKENGTYYSRYNNYDAIETIPGVKEILSPLEFFTEINSLNIQSISQQELNENREFIEDKILDNFKNHKRFSYSILDAALEIKCSPDQFKELFTVNFLKKLLMIHPEKMLYLSMSKDDTASKEKKHYFEKVLLDTLVENKDNGNIVDRVSSSDIIRLLHAQYNKLRSFSFSYNLTQEEAQHYMKCLENIYLDVLSRKLTTDSMENLLAYNELRSSGDSSNLLFCVETIPLMEKLVKNNPSINLFAVLVAHYQEAEVKFNNVQQKEIKKIINTLAKKLNKEDVQDIAAYYDFKISSKVLLQNLLTNSSENNVENSIENNFVQYKEITKENMSHSLFQKVFNIKPQFEEYLLKEKKYFGGQLINFLLRDEKKHEYLRKYLSIEEIREKVKEDQDLVRTILSHKIGKELLNIDNIEYEKELFKNVLENINKEKDNQEKINALNNELEKYEKLSDVDKHGNKETKEKIKNLHNQKDELKNQGYKIHDQVVQNVRLCSFDFLQNELDKLLSKNDFFTINSIRNQFSDEGDKKIYDYIANLDFNHIVKYLEDKNFRSLLLKSCSYKQEANLQFNNLKENERKIICQLLLDYVDSPEQVFNYFHKKDLGFIKEFLIEHLPLEALYNSNLAPNSSRENSFWRKDTLQISPYSNEELIHLYKKIEKKGNIFSYKEDANLHRFFNYNFADNEKGYLELVNYAKQNDLKLYVILSNSNIYNNLESFKSDKNVNITREEHEHNYFVKHFDISLINKGISLILDEMQAHSQEDKNYNHSLAKTAIRNVMNAFNYQKEAFKEEYGSSISEKDTYELINILLEKAPMLIAGRLGSVMNMPEHLKSHFDLHAKNAQLDKIICPDERFIPEYFSIDSHQDYYQNQYVNAIVEGMIHYCMENNKGSEISYFSYLVQQKSFFTEELQTEYAYSAPAQFENTKILTYMSELEQEHPLKKLLNTSTQKFFLEKLLNQKEEKITTKTRKI